MKKILLTILLIAAAAALWGFSAPLSTENCQNRATSGGNYAADALRYAARTEIAFIISGDLRDFTSGSETPEPEELNRMVAVKQDKVYSLSLSGKQIEAVLKKSFFLYPRANPAFLHFSGMRVVLRNNKPYRIEVMNQQNGYEKMSEGALYSVAVSQSLAEGVLGYWRLWNLEAAEDENMTMGDIIPLYSAESNQADPFEPRLLAEEEK